MPATVLFPEQMPPVRPTTSMPSAPRSVSVSLGPVGTDAEVNLQWNAKRCRPLHLLGGHALRLFQLSLGHLEEELIVNLENHLGVQSLRPQATEYGDHRHLNEVGRRPLNRAVHRQPLPELSNRLIGALQLRDRPSAPPEGGEEAAFPRLPHGPGGGRPD